MRITPGTRTAVAAHGIPGWDQRASSESKNMTPATSAGPRAGRCNSRRGRAWRALVFLTFALALLAMVGPLWGQGEGEDMPTESGPPPTPAENVSAAVDRIKLEQPKDIERAQEAIQDCNRREFDFAMLDLRYLYRATLTAGWIAADLAVTSAKRDPVAPELPTMAEAGVPGYEWPGTSLPWPTSPFRWRRIVRIGQVSLALARRRVRPNVLSLWDRRARH